MIYLEVVVARLDRAAAVAAAAQNKIKKQIKIMPVKKQKQIVVGMSGGVDSSMALVLLKERGWKPVGVSLKYDIWEDRQNPLRENICCSAESLEIARKICQKLGVPYYIFDVSEEFRRKVIDYFIKELKSNKTPNPCIICNRRLKFKKLFEWGKKHHIDYVATGHYARIRKNHRTKKYEILRAKDKEKDQTYSLSFLPQRWLKYIVFPLGNFAKSEIYNVAKQQGFEFFLKRKQSQDFCFVAGRSMERFLEKKIGKNDGRIEDIKGNVLGIHQGLHFYTIGQRRGINLVGGPYFVVGKNAKSNVLIISRDRKDLCKKEAVLSPYHFISGDRLKRKNRVLIKIRSQHLPVAGSLVPFGKTKIKLIFDKPQKSITPGQFAVFYKKGVCLGGGKIIKFKQ